MKVIDQFIKEESKKYPGTKEVKEQLEEIRDTLHIKTEEFQASGLGYAEAAQAAIRSMGDISGLMSMVSGESRVVYVNRLAAHNALIATIIMTIEILAGIFVAFGLSYILSYSPLYAPNSFDFLHAVLSRIAVVNISFNAFWPTLVVTMVCIWVWPLISIIMYKRDPLKTGSVQMNFKKIIRISLTGWAAVSAGLFAVNVFTGTNTIWFIWPLIGVSNWPVNVINFHRQLKSGKFDA